MKKPTVFLVDDNKTFLDLLSSLPEAQNFDLTLFDSAQKALEELGRNPADVIISDIEMPGMTGIELFHQVCDLAPSIPMILITAYGSTEQAVRAVQHGAFHYFEKPLTDKLPLFWATVREALAKGDMLKQLAVFKKQHAQGKKPDTALIGRSNPIRQVLQSIEMVAELPATVLLSGETGTGKELAAQLIHQGSGRPENAFFAVSCSEFASGVLESELFGHERGAFTGAVEQRKGYFEMADQGTIFLDEISDAPAALQAKLLRVLESKQLTRVGGTMTLYSDFRLIAATNQDLNQCVSEGRFRRDLLYRIKVYEIEMPPLRGRKEDIPLMAEYYLNRFNQTYKRHIDGFSEAALQALRSYAWPGNVRELINVVERAVIICTEATITTSHLPFDNHLNDEKISDLSLEGMEKFYMELALKRTAGNKTQAAQLLGISRKTLIDKVKKYQLET
jgi:DNA-binding NtrC family response regulator